MSFADGQVAENGQIDVAGDILSTLQSSTPEPAPEVAAETVAPTETQQLQVEPQQPNDDRGDHPAWAPFKELLGEQLYYSIKPQLAKMSDEYSGHVTKVNAQLEAFKPFQPLVDAQISPEYLQQALMLAQAFDSDPTALYQQMTEHLQSIGKLPANPTPAQVQVAVEDEFGGAENEGQEDPAVAALQKQVEGMQNMLLEAQTQAQIKAQTATFETQFNSEIAALPAEVKDNPQALKLVIEQAQAFLASTGRVPKMAEIAAPLLAYRESILNTPRPNDTAPRLPGSGGGIPSGGKPIDEYTKEDDINFLTSLVTKGQQQR